MKGMRPLISEVTISSKSLRSLRDINEASAVVPRMQSPSVWDVRWYWRRDRRAFSLIFPVDGWNGVMSATVDPWARGIGLALLVDELICVEVVVVVVVTCVHWILDGANAILRER